MSEMIPIYAELVGYERMANESQYKWVLSSWRNSYIDYWEQRYNPGWKTFHRDYRPLMIKWIEDHPPLIAVLKEEPDEFMSFCCGKGGHIFYVYTKGRYRTNGLASKLIDEECGKEPGVYHSKSFKKYFIRSLDQRGWRYEGEKEQSREDIAGEATREGSDTGADTDPQAGD